jgi:hypothetical protein
MNLLVTKAFAATASAPDLSIGKPENVAITNIGTLIQGILQGAMIIAAILVFAYLIWGGIQWITSGGDKGKTDYRRPRRPCYRRLRLGHHVDHLVLLWRQHPRRQHHPTQSLLTNSWRIVQFLT